MAVDVCCEERAAMLYRELDREGYMVTVQGDTARGWRVFVKARPAANAFAGLGL